MSFSRITSPSAPSLRSRLVRYVSEDIVNMNIIASDLAEAFAVEARPVSTLHFLTAWLEFVDDAS